jgi:hypothetical protein
MEPHQGANEMNFVIRFDRTLALTP